MKYRVNIDNFRLVRWRCSAVMTLVTAHRGAYEGQVGGDFKIGPGVLALDIVGGMAKDAVSLSLGGTAITQTPLTATLADTKNVLLAASYRIQKLKLSGGYEWINYSAPSDPITAVGQGLTTSPETSSVRAAPH